MRKVCVIGAGVMGSGIAAQVANSRTEVLLLDIADEESQDPSNIATQAIQKMLMQKPAPLSHPTLVKYIKPGNLRDDLSLVSDCDLVIEVIVEKLEIKHKLYKSLIPHLKGDAIIASNTSTLPLSKLKENLPKALQSRFVITHFFNPPRYMELLELVSDKDTDKNALDKVSDFISQKLGKTIIKCNDTPGFIANRIGCFLLEMAVRKAISAKLNPFVVDQIFTNLLGFPRTGIFGLYDLIGHDVMELISKSLTLALPAGDKYHEIYASNEVLSVMKGRGLLGRKSGAGFYKVIKQDGKTHKQIFDFTSMEYVDLSVQTAPNTLEELLSNNNEYSNFFTEVLPVFFDYVTNLIPEVSNSAKDIDKAMRLGYSLKFGPFELLELLKKRIPGSESWLKVRQTINYGNDNGAKFQDKARILLFNDSATLFEYEGHCIFVIKTKMNSLNHRVFELLIDSVKYAEDQHVRLIIHPGGSKHFSAGADIRFFYDKIINKDFQAIESFIDLGQKAMLALKYAAIEVVACARGLALGGGCELLLHSDYVVAHQNLNAGLVELGVGLIPGWGGVKETFLRSNSNKAKLKKGLSNILNQYQSDSSDYFMEEFNVKCHLNMNAENMLTEAIALQPIQKEKKAPATVAISGFDLSQEIETSNLDPLQQDVALFFQKIINLGNVSEADLLQLEKEKFMQLARQPLSAEKLSRFL